jgi:glycosyltransferase involved in cell wall biosynthesis
MKIAIITRTSNRPKLFNRCVDSITKQSVDIEHHVVVDNEQSLQYVEKYDSCVIHHVNREYLQTQAANSMQPDTTRPLGKMAVHNLYFNDVYKHIDSDWVFHLDDDNFLRKNTMHRLASLLSDHIDMVVVRADTFIGTLPTFKDCMLRKIRLCGIDTGCFVARTSLFDRVKWDGWKCADYRVIKHCNDLSRKTLWANLVLMKMEVNGDGLQQDRDVDFSD